MYIREKYSPLKVYIVRGKWKKNGNKEKGVVKKACNISFDIKFYPKKEIKGTQNRMNGSSICTHFIRLKNMKNIK